MLQHPLAASPNVQHKALGSLGRNSLRGLRKHTENILCRSANEPQNSLNGQLDIIGKTRPASTRDPEGAILSADAHGKSPTETPPVVGRADEVIEGCETITALLPQHGYIFCVGIIITDAQVEGSPTDKQQKIRCRAAGVSANHLGTGTETGAAVTLIFTGGTEAAHLAEILLRYALRVEICPTAIETLDEQHLGLRQADCLCFCYRQSCISSELHAQVLIMNGVLQSSDRCLDDTVTRRALLR